MDILRRLEDRLREWGASFAGHSAAGDLLQEKFAGLKSVITVGVRLSDYIIDQIEDKPTYTYFHHYRAVNTLIDQITLRGMLYLQDNGYKAVAVPASQTVNDAPQPYSGIFPHKTGAVLAGLGWIGRNALFISSDYGPRVRLGTILTNMEMPGKADILKPGCGNCTLCVDSCPAKALTGNLWEPGCEREHLVSAKACSEFMNSHFKHIGRGSVCGICVRVCPYGVK